MTFFMSAICVQCFVPPPKAEQIIAKFSVVVTHGSFKKNVFGLNHTSVSAGRSVTMSNGAGADLIVKAPEEETQCVSTQAGRPLPCLAMGCR